LSEAPIDLPSYWLEFVNQPQTAAELAAIRECVNGQKPFGEPTWTSDMEQLMPRFGTKR
jgi:hypothetical protein